MSVEGKKNVGLVDCVTRSRLLASCDTYSFVFEAVIVRP